MKYSTAPGFNPPGALRPKGLGRGGLEVRVVAGQSAATSAWAESPLKILVPRSRGPSVWACLSSFGGGLVAGDETDFTVDLGAGARCFVGTQASTKVYRNPAGRPCGHRVRANLESDSLLVFAPDPVQAFAGSSYTQQQEFFMQSGSGLVLVDWCSSGRSACGERWAFNRFRSRNEVSLAGKRVFLDSLLLDPSDGSLDAPQRMGRFNSLALVLIQGEPLQMSASRLIEEIGGCPVSHRAPLVVSASALAGGALLRIAGERVEDVGREIRRRLSFVSEMLQDDPWARKW